MTNQFFVGVAINILGMLAIIIFVIFFRDDIISYNAYKQIAKDMSLGEDTRERFSLRVKNINPKIKKYILLVISGFIMWIVGSIIMCFSVV